MKNEVKKNSFKGYQDEKVGKRLLIINELIKDFRKKKSKFKHITDLAGHVAEGVSLEEKMSCSRSTILRNKVYKKLIEDFYYSLPGSENKNKLSDLISNLSQSNSEREVVRLKQHISNLEKELDGYRNGKSASYKREEPYLSATEEKYAKLHKGFMKLINHFEGLVVINNNQEVIDLTKKTNNVITSLKK